MNEASGGSNPVPLPATETGTDETNRRLWMGNLDTRITEFALLKILQRHGDLDKFDFLYHKAGPDKGKARGYCFVSYHSRKEAEKAMRAMDGKMALSRRLVVKWAKPDVEESGQSSVLSLGKTAETPLENVSTDSKIRAIEAKLRNMERDQKDFSLSLVPEAPPGSSKYSSVARAAVAPPAPRHKNVKPYRRNTRR